MGVEVRGLTKSYGGVDVLKGVDLSVVDGEIHTLLGANGAGKSTLIKCVSGAVRPDSGVIEIDGEVYGSLTPHEAQRAGVAVIYQELSGAASLDLVDNIFLGSEIRFGPFVRRKREKVVAREWLGRLGVAIAPTTSLGALDNAERQIVEIVKALCRDPRLLILDEPTAALTERETTRLGSQVRQLREHGLPLLYVTHRLREVFELGDRVTVLRGGRVVLSRRVEECTEAELVSAIVGRMQGGRAKRARDAGSKAAGEPLLSVSGLVGPGIGPIDLAIRPGEIVGLFGLVGSGRTEILETLFGVRPVHAGVVRARGAEVRLTRPQDAIAVGIALVPSDRLQKSLFLSLSAFDNVLLPRLKRLAGRVFRRRGAEERSFATTVKTLKLQPPRGDLEAGHFSGGNQQKLVLGRWFPDEAGVYHVLLLDEPTQGVDVGARSDLYAALRTFVEGGRAVVMSSSEPQELIQLCDRIAVLGSGRIVADLQTAEVDERRLIELMQGADPVRRGGDGAAA